MSRVYTMTGHPEEVIAHAFAKTSRSAGSFDDMIMTLTQQSSDAFHSKWVLEYGHNSVAEHAMLHLAIEGVSRLAVEALESGRLASYTEQSTRYQTKTEDDVFISETWDPMFVHDYKIVVKKLFNLYDAINVAAKNDGKLLGFAGYDLSRFVLPLATKVNLGMTINARALRRTLCKMLANELPEVSGLAQQIQEVALQVTPSLLRHVKACATTQRLQSLGKHLNIIEHHNLNQDESISVVCKKFQVDADDIVKDIAYEYSTLPWGQSKWTDNPLESFFVQLGEHDTLPRALENGLISFEITSDYGSFYDMKRHRLVSLLSQKKSLGECGYIIPAPEILEKTGLLNQYIETMEMVAAYRHQWIHIPENIYMLPNAFRIRYKMDMNPRELIEIIKLRGINKNAHTSYRAIGLKMLDIASNKCPLLFEWLYKKIPDNVSAEQILRTYKLRSAE